jgi:hypothetical protein
MTKATYLLSDSAKTTEDFIYFESVQLMSNLVVRLFIKHRLIMAEPAGIESSLDNCFVVLKLGS